MPGTVKGLILVLMETVGHCFILTARERKGKNEGKAEMRVRKVPNKNDQEWDVSNLLLKQASLKT